MPVRRVPQFVYAPEVEVRFGPCLGCHLEQGERDPTEVPYLVSLLRPESTEIIENRAELRKIPRVEVYRYIRKQPDPPAVSMSARAHVGRET